MLVSGMIIGTLFTLLVLPSIYMLLAHDRVVALHSDADEVIGPTQAEGAVA
jgi:hypothetical protein